MEDHGIVVLLNVFGSKKLALHCLTGDEVNVVVFLSFVLEYINSMEARRTRKKMVRWRTKKRQQAES